MNGRAELVEKCMWCDDSSAKQNFQVEICDRDGRTTRLDEAFFTFFNKLGILACIKPAGRQRYLIGA
jgi:hypothetical protein